MFPTKVSISPTQSILPTWAFLNVIIALMGTILTFISSWWILAWTGLVLNLLAASPILALSKKSAPTEAAMKYFILQSIAATSILMMILLSQSLPLPITSLILLAALALKLGIPPFHFWVPQVFSTLPWPTILFLSTWQKLAPLAFVLTSLNLILGWPITILSLLAMTIGSIGTWTASNLKTLIAYSSINHTGWMTLLISFSPQMTALYFCLYFIQMLTLTIFILLLPPNQSNLIPNAPAETQLLMFILACTFISMSGIPPFMGFIPKLAVLMSVTPTLSMVLAITIMILTSLVITSTYLSIAMNSIPLKSWQTATQNTIIPALLLATIITPILLLSQTLSLSL